MILRFIPTPQNPRLRCLLHDRLLKITLDFLLLLVWVVMLIDEVWGSDREAKGKSLFRIEVFLLAFAVATYLLMALLDVFVTD